MADDKDIWDEQGTLTLDRASLAPLVDLPGLPPESGATGPLRVILRHFLEASVALRSRYSLRLDNGQTFNAPDIEELLARTDCPVR